VICKELSRHVGPQPRWPKLLQFRLKFCVAAGSCTMNESIAQGCKIAPSVAGSGTYQERFQLLILSPMFFTWAHHGIAV
jgi:hypothetical protein